MSPEWWLSIVGLTLFFRGAMMVPQLIASDTSSRAQALQPLTKPRIDALKVATPAGDHAKVAQLRKELSMIYKGANIKFWKYGLPFLQMPLGFGCWRLMWNMADAGIPGLATGGTLWFTNLCAPDPMHILPLATGLVNHITVRVSLDCHFTLFLAMSSISMKSSFLHAQLKREVAAKFRCN